MLPFNTYSPLMHGIMIIEPQLNRKKYTNIVLERRWGRSRDGPPPRIWRLLLRRWRRHWVPCLRYVKLLHWQWWRRWGNDMVARRIRAFSWWRWWKFKWIIRNYWPSQSLQWQRWWRSRCVFMSLFRWRRRKYKRVIRNYRSGGRRWRRKQRPRRWVNMVCSKIWWQI